MTTTAIIPCTHNFKPWRGIIEIPPTIFPFILYACRALFSLTLLPLSSLSLTLYIVSLSLSLYMLHVLHTTPKMTEDG